MKVFRLGVTVALSSAFAGQALAQNEVYAVDLRGGAQLIKFPVNAPAYAPVGATGTTALFALDFNEDGSVLYGINSLAGNIQLGTIDTTTGLFTAIAVINGAGAAETNWRGLSFDATTDTMYALGGNNLYTVNLATAATTLVAPVNGGPPTALYIDLAINNAGNLFVHDIGTDAMFSVNKTTGAAVLLGPTGQLANFAQGMDFDPATDTLYATLYTGGGVGNFVSINTTTGAATVIVNTQPWTGVGPEMEMAVRGTAAACYPDCNNDDILNLADFGCFQTAFATQNMYADCNGDLVLNLADFGCFQTEFALGCP